MDLVPAIRIAGLSEAQKRTLAIADNKLPLNARWDPDVLAVELEGLVDLGVEVELTGFSVGEFEVLLEDAAEHKRSDAEGSEDVLPDPLPGPPVARPGEVWVLGDHRIVCGDAREPDAYRAVLAQARAGLVFADPLRNFPSTAVAALPGIAPAAGDRPADLSVASGAISPEAVIASLASCLRLAKANVQAGAIVFVTIDWRHVYELLVAGKECALALVNLCVLAKDKDKDDPGDAGSLYRSGHEFVAVYQTGAIPGANGIRCGPPGRIRSDLWSYPAVKNFRKGRHDKLAIGPTLKPVALIADAIEDVSRPGDLVLTPFAGLGTSLIAAQKTGRRGRAIEAEPRYVDLAIRRWQAYAGTNATLSATGQTFDEIRDQRHDGALLGSMCHD